MDVEQAKAFVNQTQRETALIAHLVDAGYARTEPAILQPAAVFLELAGEEHAHRTYVTSDPRAPNLPAARIHHPVCLAYLASASAGRPAQFSYFGRVFRIRSNGPERIYQAGLESFGRADREAADAEIIDAVAGSGRSRAKRAGSRCKLGDAGMLLALLGAIEAYAVWLRRIRRATRAARNSLADLRATGWQGGGADHSGVLARSRRRPQGRARPRAGSPLHRRHFLGRRPHRGEIAERFLEQAALRDGAGFAQENAQVIES